MKKKFIYGRHIGRLKVDFPWKMASHVHASHELIVILKGTLSLRCPDGNFSLSAGDVVIYPAGMPHAEEGGVPEVLETYFAPFACSAITDTRLIRKHDHTGRVRQIAHWLIAENGSRNPLAIEEQQALFEALMARLFNDSQGMENELIRRIRTFVETHLDESLTLSRLAKESGFSSYYFARTYRRLTGATPMQDVRRMRLNMARDLVMSTTLPLKDIAEKTGFGNPYAFSRLFRRQFEMPPGEFRRRQGHG